MTPPAIVIGTAAADSLLGTDADELFFAGAGADTVDAGAGDDEAWGGLGDDLLRGGDGADTLVGGAGDDRLEGGTGRNYLDGGEGRDTLVAGGEGDVLDGGAGDDVLLGGAGDDAIYTGGGANLVRAGGGDDRVFADAGDNDIDAGDGDDAIFLDVGANRVVAGAGNDTVYGDDGSDTVLGGDGDDDLTGYGGDDDLDGGAGDDEIDGDDGDDAIKGGEGDNDLDGGGGNDTITAGGGNDAIDGGGGDDLIQAGDGANLVDGGDGNDRITTGAGNDVIEGGDGDDVIAAGAGDDAIEGGGGADLLTGGEGRDTFVVGFEARRIAGAGDAFGALVADTITDFRAGPGGDRLDLGDLGRGLLASRVTSYERERWYDYFHQARDVDYERAYAGDLFKQGVARFVQDGADAVLQLDTDVTGGEGGWRTLLRLENVGVAALTQDNLVQAAGRPTADFRAEDGRQGTDAGEAFTADPAGGTIYARGGNDTLAGGAGADVLVGGEGADELRGGAGDDALRGDAGADTLAGGAGKDLLVGGEGDDTYLFALGDGVDMVADSGGGNDVLLLGAGIGRDRLEVIQDGSGQTLVLVVATSATSTDRIVLENGGGIERVRFADGSELTLAQLYDLARAGSAGPDAIIGTRAADTLRGGDRDYLTGLGGGDTYRFDRGDGMVSVEDLGPEGDSGPAGEIDAVEFGAGIAADEVVVRQVSSYNLIFEVGDGDRLTLVGPLGAPGSEIERVRFADGTTWTYEDAFDRSLAGRDGADRIAGDARDNTISGGGGRDTLSGRLGSDTYLYARGDGRDGIDDISDLDGDYARLPGNTDVDVLRFQGDITAAEVRVTGGYRDGFTLVVGDPDNRDEVQIIGIDRVAFADGTVWTVEDLRVQAYRLPTALADTLSGTAGDDAINALAGDDAVYAGAGDDAVEGGAGDDLLYGEAGSDTLQGGEGDDTLHGDDLGDGTVAGDDDLRGGAGDDLITAGAGNDRIDGGEGDDLLVVDADSRYFEVTRAGGAVILRDLRELDGTDTITGVETIAFDDLLLDVGGLNAAPVLGLDRLDAREDAALVFTAADLLANDTDADGDALSVVSVRRVSGGEIALAASGAITFTPDGPDPATVRPSFTGTAEFSYTVSDGHGGLGTRTSFIEVAPVNDAPVLAPGAQRWSGTEDVPFAGSGQARVAAGTDEENGALAYEVVAGSAVGGTVMLDPATRAWSFTPDRDFNGEASFRYRAFDGELYSAAATVVVAFAPVADAPVLAHPLADFGGLEDVAVSFALPADAFSDPDGDALTLAARLSDGSALPGWLRFDAAARSFSGTPPRDFNGALDVTVTARDPGGLSASDSFRLTLAPVNDAPVAGADRASGVEDTPLRVALAALLANDSDPDGDALGVTAVGGAVHGTVALDLAGGAAVFIAERDYNGSGASFTYTVSDGHGGTATQTVALDLAAVNDAPTAAAAAEAFRGQEDAVLRGRLLAGADADGDALTYRLVAGSATHGTVGLDAAGAFTFTGAANYNGAASFRYQVLDGHGGVSAEKAVAITLDAVNDAPNAVADAGFATDAGKAVTIKAATLLANDTDPDGDALRLAAVTAGIGGKVALDAAGDVVFTPTAGFSGAASFTYTVADGHGGTGSAGVSLTVKPTSTPTPTITGTEGADLLTGTDKAEVINARGGADLVLAGGGDDEVRGGEGSDALFGGIGNDRLWGDAGNDALFGEAGNDRLDGGAGNDALTGGAGNDVFAFGRGFGWDAVLDFAAGPGAGDVLDLSALGFHDLAAVRAAAREVSVLSVPNVVIDAGADGSLTLVNVRLSALVADDFLFG